MPRTVKKYWENGQSASQAHEQRMVDTYKSEYTTNKLTQVSLVNNVRIVPSIIPLSNHNVLSHNYCQNAWKTSTYHLNNTHRTGMVKLPPIFK